MKNFLVTLIAGTGILMLLSKGTEAQWVQTTWPPTGVAALAVNGGNLFAGTGGSGVYVSTNNGTSWTAVNTGLTNLQVNALLANGSNLFAGTNGGGVFLTTNNGTNWSAVNTGLTGLTISALGAYGRYIFAGTDSGKIFRTANNGTNWTHLITFAQPPIYAFLSNGTHFFAGTYGYGVEVTTDSGTNWTPANNGLTTNYVFSLVANGNNLFAGMNSWSISHSTDNGTNWTAVNNGLTSVFNGYTLMASGGNVFAGFAMGGVFLTTNNGTDWIDFNTGLTGLPPVLSLVASGNYIFAGTGGPVFRRLLSDVANLPAAPTLSSPANGATGVALNPAMIWNAVTGATTYRLQVSTSSSFSSTVVNDSTLSGTSRTIGPLAGATVYYWRVRAKNSYGTGNWSTVWSFTTIGQPPDAPGLVSPADSATIAVPSVTFSWSASSGAASYTLNVSAAPDFSTLAVNQSGITSISQLVSSLSNNTTYYWRVNAVNPAGTSPWSDTWSFTMAWDTAWGLIAYWNFDSVSGNTYYDVTGHGYDATSSGTNIGITSGISGNALHCTGSGFDCAVANSRGNFCLNTFTIEAWYYPDTVGPQQHKIFTFDSIRMGMGNGYTFTVDGSGLVATTIWSQVTNNWVTVNSTTSLVSNHWYYIVGTYDGSNLRTYVNGNLEGTSAIAGGPLYPVGLEARIGCESTLDRGVIYNQDGKIDELKLYNYALPADSVVAHYIQSAIKPTQKIPSFASTLKVQARNSLLTISLPSAMLGKAIDLTVYTASGREVMRRKVQSGAERFTAPVPGLALGAYVLAVKDGSKKITARFVFVR
jgi:hypothetical protein